MAKLDLDDPCAAAFDGCCPHQQVSRDCTTRFLRARLQVHRNKSLHRISAKDQWTEFWRTRQVVLHSVPRGDFRAGCKLAVRIKDGRIGSAISIRKIEPPSGQPLTEKPDTPGTGARRLGLDEFFDRCGSGREKQALEDREIEPLILQGEGEVGLKTAAGRMSRRIDPPAVFLKQLVPFPCSAQDTR